MQILHELTSAALEKEKSRIYDFLIKNLFIWKFSGILNLNVNY